MHAPDEQAPKEPKGGGEDREGTVVPFKPRPVPRQPEPDDNDPGPNPAA